MFFPFKRPICCDSSNNTKLIRMIGEKNKEIYINGDQINGDRISKIER